MIGLYLPGTSLLHRLAAGWKLAGLLVAAVLVMRQSTLRGVGVAAAVVLLLAAVAQLPWRVGLVQLRPIGWLAVPLFALQWFTSGPVRAGVVVGQLVVLVALAAVVTLTTRVTGMLDAFEYVLRPFARVGIDPARVGLVLALAVRCVPLVSQAYHEARDARRARGLEHSPIALAVPLVIRLLKRADAMGEALAARGADD